MPRYHFHVSDGDDVPDAQGTDLPDLAAVRVEALRYAGALLADAPEIFWSGEEWSMTVTDADQLTLFVLQFTATQAPAVGEAIGGAVAAAR